MAYSHTFFEVLFLITVGILWSMIFYQLFFTFMGLFYRIKTTKEKRIHETDKKNLPPVSILVPAHNEERVIEKTLESLCRMDYPFEKIEIVVVNDGSMDRTPQIVEEFQRKDPRVKLYSIPEEEAGKGKPHALNRGLSQVKQEYIAVYDADNTPESDSLRYLVLNLMDNPVLASTFGKFRTRNQKRNLLTRFINLETLSFQFMIQAGRYLLLKLALLPGTNFLIRRKALVECGGWDENALTEDTELSIRLYKKGYQIKFVPYSVTWEEEPEKWGVWLKQRCRWVRGNFYILRKFFLSSFRSKKLNVILELSYIFLLYYLFLASILFSHLFFITGCLGFIAVLSPGPYLAVWGCAFLLFITEIMMVASFEGEASFENLGVTTLMYFSYCQGWIVLVFRALYQEIFKKPVHWEKTPRFASQENPGERDDHEH